MYRCEGKGFTRGAIRIVIILKGRFGGNGIWSCRAFGGGESGRNWGEGKETRSCWKEDARLKLINIRHGSTGLLHCQDILPIGISFEWNETTGLRRAENGWAAGRSLVASTVFPRIPSFAPFPVLRFRRPGFPGLRRRSRVNLRLSDPLSIRVLEFWFWVSKKASSLLPGSSIQAAFDSTRSA